MPLTPPKPSSAAAASPSGPAPGARPPRSIVAACDAHCLTLWPARPRRCQHPGLQEPRGDGALGDGAVLVDEALPGDGALPGGGALPADGALGGDGALPGDGTLPCDATLSSGVRAMRLCNACVGVCQRRRTNAFPKPKRTPSVRYFGIASAVIRSFLGFVFRAAPNTNIANEIRFARHRTHTPDVRQIVPMLPTQRMCLLCATMQNFDPNITEQN